MGNIEGPEGSNSTSSWMQSVPDAPIDIKLDGTDLLELKVRREIEAHIDEQDPYCVTFACSLWPVGILDRVVSSKNEVTRDAILQQRDAWYPCLKWIEKMVRKRMARKFIVENPWPSDLGNTLCMDKLVMEGPCDAESHETVELFRGDQCEFGLIKFNADAPANMCINPWKVASAPNFLSTGLPLCARQSSMDDLHSRTVMAAFHEVSNEEAEYGEGELGSLDYIYDEDDLSRNPILPERVDSYELQRQKNTEEAPNPPDLTELEAARKFKWLRIPRETRVAIRRLHHMIGYGSNSSMLQLLRTARASSEACEAVRHFACEACKKREPVKKALVVKETNKMVFNHETSAGCFEVHDAAGNGHTVLSVVTLYHQAWWVAAGGVPMSRVCAEMLLNGWIQPFGPPRIFTCDRGVHNRGRVYDLLRAHGIQLRFAGLEAPFQIGRAERQGG
eukprot:s292_g30.t1